MWAASRQEPLYCRAVTLAGIDGFLHAHGVSASALFKSQNIEPELLSRADAFLPWDAVCQLFEDAAKEAGLAHFGLLWSAALTADHRQFGPLVHLANLPEKTGEFLRTAARYQLIHKNGMRHTIHSDKRLELVRWRTTPHPQSGPCRQMVEHSISNSYRMVDQFLSDTRIDEVHFTYPEPEDSQLFDAMFTCPIIFGAQHNQIVTRKCDLDRDLKTIVPASRDAVKAYLDYHGQAFTGAPRTLGQTISGDLPVLFGVNRTDMTSIAQVYGMSEKKLQRLLRDEGTNFSNLRDAARRSLADSLLSQTPIPIARLAIFLDYASPHTFHHACRRWFGMSAREFRRKFWKDKNGEI